MYVSYLLGEVPTVENAAERRARDLRLLHLSYVFLVLAAPALTVARRVVASRPRRGRCFLDRAAQQKLHARTSLLRRVLCACVTPYLLTLIDIELWLYVQPASSYSSLKVGCIGLPRPPVFFGSRLNAILNSESDVSEWETRGGDTGRDR